MSDRLEAGEKAPGFTAVAAGGEYGAGGEVSLADFAGRMVVLYFNATVKPADHVEKLLEVLG